MKLGWPNSKLTFWLSVLAVSFLASILMTLAVLLFLSDTTTGKELRAAIGIDSNGLNIETTRVDKVVVEESSAIIETIKKVGPAVVSITSGEDAFRDIPGFGRIQAPRTSGTGFIITSDGLIATNKHVVRGFETFTVTAASGETYQGKVMATDPSNDIAFIKIEARGLPVADLGDSDRVQVGQWVTAVGNALGELQNTVTVGVISAKERSATPEGEGELYGLIQTDAAINPGNSGGPLVNLSGQVIGMNTAIAGNAQNIGFAIAVNDLKKDLELFSKHGKIIQAYMGVRYQTITKAIAQSLSLPVEQGALLVTLGNAQPAVIPGSPAEQASLKEADIIVKVNDDRVSETTPLVRLIRRYSPEDQITLTILRGGSEMTVNLTLGQVGG